MRSPPILVETPKSCALDRAAPGSHLTSHLPISPTSLSLYPPPAVPAPKPSFLAFVCSAMSSTYSVKQTHGKQHALRRKISDARGEISRLVGELDALSSKIKQSEARAAEMELLVSNAHSKFATSTTRSLYFSPLQTESRRNHFSSAPTSPTSARSTRRDRHMNAKKEQLNQLSKQLARKQAELDALCEQLEQIEATSLEAASLLPRGGVRSPPLSTRASYRLESELSYISRQRKAKALQPEKRARRRYQRQKLLLEEFDNEVRRAPSPFLLPSPMPHLISSAPLQAVPSPPPSSFGIPLTRARPALCNWTRRQGKYQFSHLIARFLPAYPYFPSHHPHP